MGDVSSGCIPHIFYVFLLTDNQKPPKNWNILEGLEHTKIYILLSKDLYLTAKRFISFNRQIWAFEWKFVKMMIILNLCLTYPIIDIYKRGAKSRRIDSSILRQNERRAQRCEEI